MRHPVIQWITDHHLGHCLTVLPIRPPRVTQWSSEVLVITLDSVWRATDSATMRHPVIQWITDHHLGHCLTVLPIRPPRAIQWFTGHHLGHCPWDPPVSGTYTGDVTLDDLEGTVWIRRISRVSRLDTSTVRVFPPGHLYTAYFPAWTPLQPLIPPLSGQTWITDGQWDPKIVLILGQRRRHWPNIKTTPGHHLVFVGYDHKR